MALHIYIDTIPHSDQRYPTVGDYWRPVVPHQALERTEIRVSDMNNESFELLVAIHEMVEEYLTRKHGITDQAITEFDVLFETNRALDSIDEPGDSPNAPYHEEHKTATEIEKLIAAELGINWTEYERTVNNL